MFFLQLIYGSMNSLKSNFDLQNHVYHFYFHDLLLKFLYARDYIYLVVEVIMSIYAYQ